MLIFNWENYIYEQNWSLPNSTMSQIYSLSSERINKRRDMNFLFFKTVGNFELDPGD